MTANECSLRKLGATEEHRILHINFCKKLWNAIGKNMAATQSWMDM